MGVCGEKHTSLTREQKRQLIHQADTHKLRPTEVCDWVQATWGLRIARVTVYSILHKQRASLMAGHKDLYQTMQNSLNGSSSDPQSLTDSNTDVSGQKGNKDSGRVNKYRSSPVKNKNKVKENTKNVNDAKIDSLNATNNDSKRDRSGSVVSDRSSSSVDGSNAEGARWEGQLKRVREPASVELDRAMVEFLKSPASVDSQGRRLNDAELQAHALRLAQSIPSASRMRCSFGWLRHFKRRLGVQWAADKLGRYRWTVEMDPHQLEGSYPGSPSNSAKQELSNDVSDDEEEYHSTNEFGSDGRNSPLSPSPTKANQDNAQPQNIENSYANLFGTLPALHVPTSDSSMGTISPLATTLDPKLTSTTFSQPASTAASTYGMSVDGRMRKVPTKEEAYDMLQSLLMYYEQDHTYTGEQQTLLLPRWIHQQRQLMQQSPEVEAKMMWMRQQHQQHQQSQQLPYQSLYQPFMFPFQNMSTESQQPQQPYSSFSSTPSSVSSTLSPSPPSLSPMSPMSPMSPLSPESPTVTPYSLGLAGGSSGYTDPFACVKADPSFTSAYACLGHHMLNDTSLLFSTSLQRNE
ncbi:hypothetical protein BGZ79_001298 [Entomortierella chlamydospora]|nr:hypothetical protein BGZ79_001298 [Entomortierella chlamydospora]